MILTSAVYFQNAWKILFTETTNVNFCVSTMTYVEVQMMHVADFFNYYKNDKLKISAVEIPYRVCRTLSVGYESVISTVYFLTMMIVYVQEGGYSMVVVLPDRINGCIELENMFLSDSKMFSALISNMTVNKVNLDLPKFKYESEFSLKRTLETVSVMQACIICPKSLTVQLI